MYNQQQPVGQAAAATNAAQMNQMLSHMMSPLIPNPYMMFQPRIPITLQRPPQLAYPQNARPNTRELYQWQLCSQCQLKGVTVIAFYRASHPCQRQFAPATTFSFFQTFRSFRYSEVSLSVFFLIEKFIKINPN
nr:unnamed protein product [Callosobruchus analis]